MQIKQTAIDSQRALAVTKGSLATKERERKILQLTTEEITSLSGDVNMYKGVGKMWVVNCHLRSYLLVNERVCYVYAQVYANAANDHGRAAQKARKGTDWWYQESQHEGNGAIEDGIMWYWHHGSYEG